MRVKCAHCQHAMTWVSMTHHGKTHGHFVCYNANCHSKTALAHR